MGTQQNDIAKFVEDMDEDDLHCLLIELADNTQPMKDKGELARRLKSQDAKTFNESSFTSFYPTTTTTNARHSLGRASTHGSRIRGRAQGANKTNNTHEANDQDNHHHAPAVAAPATASGQPLRYHQLQLQQQQKWQQQPQCHSYGQHTTTTTKPSKASYAQSMQELRTSDNCSDSQSLCGASATAAAISKQNIDILASSFRGGGGGGGVSNNRKPNRANSFTMPSSSDNFTKQTNSSTSMILDQQPSLRLTNNVDGVPLSTVVDNDKQTSHVGQPPSSQSSLPPPSSSSSSAPITTTTTSPPPAPPPPPLSLTGQLTAADGHLLPNSSQSIPINSSTGNLNSSARQSHNHNHRQASLSSVHLNHLQSFVNSIDSSTVHSSHSEQSRSRARLNSHSLQLDEDDDDQRQFPVMDEQQKSVNEFITEYGSYPRKDQENNHIERPLLLSLEQKQQPLVNKPEDDALPFPTNFPSALLHPPYPSFGPNGHGIGTNHSANHLVNAPVGNRKYSKKKSKAERNVRMSEDIEGYIGYKDVSFLESFVLNADNNDNAAKGAAKKKDRSSKIEVNNDNKRVKCNENGSSNGVNNNVEKTESVSKDSSVSNSSSLSGDELIFKDAVNASLEQSSDALSKYNKKSKNNCSRNKASTNKQQQNVCEKESHVSQETEEKYDLNDETQHNNSNDRAKTTNSASSEGTDAEDDDDLPAVCARSQKSNSLLITQTHLPLQEEENQCTVSDSEMADREKDFVTPKTKHFKKKYQSTKPNQFSVNNSNSSNSSGGGSGGSGQIGQGKSPSDRKLAYNSNSDANLSRGYESEQECSFSNGLPPNAYASQSLSSLPAINMKSVDRRLLPVSKRRQAQQQTAASTSSKLSDFIDSSNGGSDSRSVMVSETSANSGPKVPSYAEIAKANSLSKQLAAATAKVSSVDNASISTDFPQLKSRSPQPPAQTPSPILETISTSNDSASEYHSAECTMLNEMSPKTETSLEKSFTPDHSIIEKVVSPENIAQNNNNNTSTDSLEETAIITMNDTDVNTTITNNVEHQPNFLAEMDTLENTAYSPPVVIFGENSVENFSYGEITNDSHLSEYNIVDGQKLVFGFFDDSEMSMINEAELNISDDKLYSTKDSDLGYQSNPETTNGVIMEVGSSSTNNVQYCERAQLGEHFFKNAVHVNDLEEQMLSHRTSEPLLACSNVSPPTSGSSLSSDLPNEANELQSTYSANKANTIVSKPSNMSKLSTDESNLKANFVSCVKDLSNYRFVDNADHKSYNYYSVAMFVSNAWTQCHKGP